jgi:hypothetical protein
MIAAISEALLDIVMEVSDLKAEGNMRKLESVQLGVRRQSNVQTYPIMIRKADRVAAALQYHRV